MGSAVLEFMADHEYTPTVKRIGIPDKFVQHGTVAELYQLCGMDEDSLTKELLKQCELLPSYMLYNIRRFFLNYFLPLLQYAEY